MCLSSVLATIITATAGTTVGWTSPTLPLLLSQNSHIPITPDQSSWITSLMILASALSPFPASYMVDIIGRKMSLLLAAIPYLIGWITIMEAGSVNSIYIGRMLQGLGYGIVYTTAPMYLGEIASNDMRGSMATLITVMSKVIKCIISYNPIHIFFNPYSSLEY
jgi:MFS family permease